MEKKTTQKYFRSNIITLYIYILMEKESAQNITQDPEVTAILGNNNIDYNDKLVLLRRYWVTKRREFDIAENYSDDGRRRKELAKFTKDYFDTLFSYPEWTLSYNQIANLIYQASKIVGMPTNTTDENLKQTEAFEKINNTLDQVSQELFQKILHQFVHKTKIKSQHVSTIPELQYWNANYPLNLDITMYQQIQKDVENVFPNSPQKWMIKPYKDIVFAWGYVYYQAAEEQKKNEVADVNDVNVNPVIPSTITEQKKKRKKRTTTSRGKKRTRFKTKSKKPTQLQVGAKTTEERQFVPPIYGLIPKIPEEKEEEESIIQKIFHYIPHILYLLSSLGTIISLLITKITKNQNVQKPLIVVVIALIFVMLLINIISISLEFWNTSSSVDSVNTVIVFVQVVAAAFNVAFGIYFIQKLKNIARNRINIPLSLLIVYIVLALLLNAIILYLYLV